MYKDKKNAGDRKEFTEQWKSLREDAKEAGLSTDDLFRQYMHIVRGKENIKAREVGLRKFYAMGKYRELKEQGVMEYLQNLCDFWIEVKRRDRKRIPLLAHKYLHILQRYPNEYWKYATAVFVHRNENKGDFPEKLTLFLEKITAFFLAKYIESPTVNAIKFHVYQLCIDIFEEKNIEFHYSPTKDALTEEGHIKAPTWSRSSLLLLHAYLNKDQTELLPTNFHIEHILPRSWQETNYNGWNREDADAYLEKMGNLIALEGKINIQAGNGYFGRKKEKYKKSQISLVKKLSQYPKNDWVKEDIERRGRNLPRRCWIFWETSRHFIA